MVDLYELFISALQMRSRYSVFIFGVYSISSVSLLVLGVAHPLAILIHFLPPGRNVFFGSTTMIALGVDGCFLSSIPPCGLLALGFGASVPY